MGRGGVGGLIKWHFFFLPLANDFQRVSEMALSLKAMAEFAAGLKV